MIEDTVEIVDPELIATFFEDVAIPPQEYRGVQVVALYPNDMPFQNLVDDAFLFFENVTFSLLLNGQRHVLKDNQTVLMKEYKIDFTYNDGDTFILEAELPGSVAYFSDKLIIKAMLKPKIKSGQKHACTCPMSVVLNRGCQCGGV